MADEHSRNPIIMPAPTVKRVGCPKCGHPDFDGRRIQGTLTFTCKNKECRNQWQGGLPTFQQDPTKPMPPTSHTPDVQFLEIRSKDGSVLSHEEIRRPQSTTQAFRRGAPVPDGEDY